MTEVQGDEAFQAGVAAALGLLDGVGLGKWVRAHIRIIRPARLSELWEPGQAGRIYPMHGGGEVCFAARYVPRLAGVGAGARGCALDAVGTGGRSEDAGGGVRGEPDAAVNARPVRAE